jgi:mannose-6-phosphate isomerase-like protein (cupin superfamily)
MDHQHGRPTRDRPVVVSPTDLAEPPEQQTPGIRRQQAFVADDRWIGYIRTTPGEWSGWHHHGETDTYFYVLRGGLEFELRAEDTTISVGPGDFAHMPAGVVHRERTAPGPGGEAVLVRIGRGPAVVNVDDPAAAD